MLSCQKDLFSIEESITYLNCAYMSPLMHSVVEAGRMGLLSKAQPYRLKVDDFFDMPQQLREAFAQAHPRD